MAKWIEHTLWGAGAGAVVVMIVGFSTGWVVTNGTAEEMAERRADNAVISSLTPICVAQFKNQTQQEEETHFTALEEKDSWNREDYISEHGWATMPGNKEANDEVADACASELMKIAEK